MTAGRMDEALVAWERGAATSLPLIPGSDAVPEDVLDLVYQCSMNAGMGHAQRAATSGRIASLDEAEPHFLRARMIAERGLAQGARPGAAARTDWKRHLGEADLWLSRLGELRARLGSSAR